MSIEYPKLPEKMYENYFIRREEDLKKLASSLQQNSSETPDLFHKIGHQVMGNARNFGFLELEDIAKKLESVPADQIQTLGPLLLEEFSNWIEKTRKTLFH